MDYFAEIKALSDKRNVTEAEAMERMEPQLGVYRAAEQRINARARKYLEGISREKPSLVQNMISQYPLKTEQGYAIMSLAECLDRVPDKETAYELIEDKIGHIKWNQNKTHSSIVMNAVAHSLNLASKMGGNALVYSAMKSAFRVLGKEFILGEDMVDAVEKARGLKKDKYHISYDMLGEGARTSWQAENYLKSYIEAAEKAVAESADIFENDSISLKISALHPRYELLKYEQLRIELLPRLRQVVEVAKRRNIALIMDAEEAARLDLWLLIFAELYLDDAVRYEGLGLAVQAYNKGALQVLEFLQKLAAAKGVKIPVRLVKGAYWDYEIKRAQAEGLATYPVYTKKEFSDISYLGCAKYMLDNIANFYPQFATHNVLTIASIIEIARVPDRGANGDCERGRSRASLERAERSSSGRAAAPHGEQINEFEFQKLYGMGDETYSHILPEENIKCRVYAPVGEQKELLAYLIRRLLENGANNSFVHQLALAKDDFSALLNSPFMALKNPMGRIKPPQEIYNGRRNSRGYDLGDLQAVQDLKAVLERPEAVLELHHATAEDCAEYIAAANKAFVAWNARGADVRAEILEKIADNFEANAEKILKLLTTEARRNLPDAISELREAVDFCRYYAQQARLAMQPRKMQGITGEDNIYQLEGRGVFVCISPWNFPLAIFTGQVVAALGGGNCVIAKPAEQTPKIAALAVKLMHEAGVPEDVVRLVVGSGSKLGAALTGNANIAGVCFTGSTATAHVINKSIVENNRKIIPFIAETGGQNCMVVDSTALLERTVDDMVISAFGSAGQRCSALRVAYVHEDVADSLVEVLKGAMAELEVNFADRFSTDVSEVIDEKAKEGLEKHVANMKESAKLVYAAAAKGQGNFVPPHLFEIKSISELSGEVFGPVLHIIRYNNLDKVIDEINSTGYGLTFGIQTRIAKRVSYLAEKIHAGNIYVNRSMIGAVVESQPFGGHGLSGTGPKAGGPEYLKRFCVEKVVTVNKTAIGGNLELL